MITKAKIENNALGVLSDNRFFFLEGVGKYLQTRTFIHNIISNNEDIYSVNEFKDDLVI